MSGLSDEQLDDLVARVEDFLEDSWDKLNGRPKSLCLRDAVIVTCSYMRNNIIEEVWAEIFGVSQSCSPVPTTSRSRTPSSAEPPTLGHRLPC
jgi:hypothetical protein